LAALALSYVLPSVPAAPLSQEDQTPPRKNYGTHDNTPYKNDDDHSVRVLNDFEAVGYGIPALDPSKDLLQVSGPRAAAGAPGGAGPPLADDNAPSAAARRTAPKVVMGPGTGLGAAQLFFDSGTQDYVVIPGEGAHATFAPRGWRQTALAAWAAPKLGGMVEIEAVACGGGLELIYEFLLSDDDTCGRPGDLPQSRRVREIILVFWGVRGVFWGGAPRSFRWGSFFFGG